MTTMCLQDYTGSDAPATTAEPAAKHTPGPWRAEPRFTGRPNSDTLPRVIKAGPPEDYRARVIGQAHNRHDTDRIVACVNAMEGIADPVRWVAAVRELVAGLCEDCSISDTSDGWHGDNIDALTDAEHGDPPGTAARERNPDEEDAAA